MKICKSAALSFALMLSPILASASEPDCLGSPKDCQDIIMSESWVDGGSGYQTTIFDILGAHYFAEFLRNQTLPETGVDPEAEPGPDTFDGLPFERPDENTRPEEYLPEKE